MERIIQRVDNFAPVQPKLTRVCAYARVSCGKDAMLHSLSAQVSHYSNLIQNHSGWLYCGVYSDEAVTGTKEQRDGFQRMLEACRARKVDLVITKSISRFARNTVTLLETVRELKLLGIDVYFEEQNIHTMSADGELMLTILASYAQEESLSVSENMKWRVRKTFQAGLPWNGGMLGYRNVNGTFVIVPEEAELVRRIFREYRNGKGIMTICKELNAEGVKAHTGKPWCKSSLTLILRHYAYTGNLLLQRTFRESHLSKGSIINRGQLPMYHVDNSHEPIIPLEEYNEVQELLKRKSEKFNRPGGAVIHYPFTGRIACGCCGKHYRRKVTHAGVVWICATYNVYGKAVCPSKQIPETTLFQITAEVLGVEEITADLLDSRLSFIRAENGNRVVFGFKDGTQTEKQWKDRSRAESWTDEMRESARQKTARRYAK